MRTSLRMRRSVTELRLPSVAIAAATAHQCLTGPQLMTAADHVAPRSPAIERLPGETRLRLRFRHLVICSNAGL